MIDPDGPGGVSEFTVSPPLISQYCNVTLSTRFLPYQNGLPNSITENPKDEQRSTMGSRSLLFEQLKILPVGISYYLHQVLLGYTCRFWYAPLSCAHVLSEPSLIVSGLCDCFMGKNTPPCTYVWPGVLGLRVPQSEYN